ncbi:hypothetical protein MSAN_01116700 [Mycena sanguinolenta]|uniref:Uncharacterized protein n=1 Tax=Mycena sanguinolenta TaxID=230812 RepID=A0A8H6YLF6_9AGAR|nr:hypothetical protein MSAN_01116700 [Mycena sanguinolenta]
MVTMIIGPDGIRVEHLSSFAALTRTCPPSCADYPKNLVLIVGATIVLMWLAVLFVLVGDTGKLLSRLLCAYPGPDCAGGEGRHFSYSDPARKLVILVSSTLLVVCHLLKVKAILLARSILDNLNMCFTDPKFCFWCCCWATPIRRTWCEAEGPAPTLSARLPLEKPFNIGQETPFGRRQTLAGQIASKVISVLVISERTLSAMPRRAAFW